MDQRELVSVIMPAYNAGKFIKETISSVIAQTYSNWELIIIDDGSTDDTKAIVEKYVTVDKRIKYFCQQNGKQGKARNKGISQSAGSLIAFLDADDLWFPLKLEKQITLLNETNADLVFSYVDQIDANGLKVGGWEPGNKHECYHGDSGLSFFFRRNIVHIFTVLARRQAVLQVNSFKEEPEIQNIEDYDLWLRMLQNNCRFVLINEVLGAYRLHDTQTIKGKSSVMKILTMLTEMQIEKKVLAADKNKAVKLWMIRCLKYDIDREELRKTIAFYPGYLGRSIFETLVLFTPQNLLKKIVAYSCKEQLLKSSVIYARQKAASTFE